MNGYKALFLAALAIVGPAAVTANAQEYRTDINPALRYYEALIMGPNLSKEDDDYLFQNEWRGQKLPEKFGNLVSEFDASFRLIREAGQATVPCDWGIDLSRGPETLLPHLARLKHLALTAKLRAMWDLQNGKEAEARDDLLAVFVLGRNSSQDGTLIAVLVELAIENIVMNTVAENFHFFSAEALQQLNDGFDAAPPGNTEAAAMLTGEKTGFHDWLKRKILQWQSENPGDDDAVMTKVRDLGKDMAEESGTNHWAQVIGSAGGSAGILKLLDADDIAYQKAAEILALPHPAFEEQAGQFQSDVDKSGNSLMAFTLPAIMKARPKEFRTQIKLAMLHAALAYKLHGEDGLREVSDPCGNGPFQVERFIFEGADRGFKLNSAYSGNGYIESMIFVESGDAAFVCDGKSVGQPLSK